MIINGYRIQKDINGHDYIEFINPDIQGDTEWTKFWYNLIFTIKDIIPNSQDLVYDSGAEFGFRIECEYFKTTADGFSIDITYGKIKIPFNCFNGIILTADNNNELIKRISVLLDNSNFFTKVQI